MDSIDDIRIDEVVDTTAELMFPKSGRPMVRKPKKKTAPAKASLVAHVGPSNGTGLSTHIERGQIELGQHFRLTPTELVITKKPTFDACQDFGEMLRVVDRAVQFAVGDFINYIEAEFGEDASQIVDAADWSETTIRVYRWVAAKVEPQRRRVELTFAHHQLVAELEPIEQVNWLTRAAEGSDGHPWSVSDFRKMLKAGADAAAAASADRFFVQVEVDGEKQQDELVRQLANLGHEGDRVKKIAKSKKRPSVEAQANVTTKPAVKRSRPAKKAKAAKKAKPTSKPSRKAPVAKKKATAKTKKSNRSKKSKK
jgi:hypothetical protein